MTLAALAVVLACVAVQLVVTTLAACIARRRGG